jgi:hypothetical protein
MVVNASRHQHRPCFRPVPVQPERKKPSLQGSAHPVNSSTCASGTEFKLAVSPCRYVPHATQVPASVAPQFLRYWPAAQLAAHFLHPTCPWSSWYSFSGHAWERWGQPVRPPGRMWALLDTGNSPPGVLTHRAGGLAGQRLAFAGWALAAAGHHRALDRSKRPRRTALQPAPPCQRQRAKGQAGCQNAQPITSQRPALCPSQPTRRSPISQVAQFVHEPVFRWTQPDRKTLVPVQLPQGWQSPGLLPVAKVCQPSEKSSK